MKNALIMSFAILIFAVGGLFVLHRDSDALGQSVSLPKTEILRGGKRVGVSVDRSKCTLQPNGNYFCPADALASFPTTSVVDTATNATCTVSYDREGGFSFSGPTKTAIIPAGELAVSSLESGVTSNIARSAAGYSLSLHVRENGTVDHVLLVGTDYSSEQCLEVTEPTV